MTYKPEDIIIVGDSFCVHREKETDWPVYLTKLLTGTKELPRGKGFGGQSWWSVRKELLLELKKAPCKVLVLCHTEAHRIWSDLNRPINFASVERDFNLQSTTGPDYVDSKDLNQAAALYYKYLYSVDFHNWSNQAWFNELVEIVVNNNIEKVIHLHCFRFGDDQINIFKKGVTITNVLNEYVAAEDKVPREGLNPRISNHFTHELNVKFASELYKVITSNIADTTATLSL